jgi:hypothetical protein
MKKVAVIISGHMRTINQCWQSWIEYSKKNDWDCDYYLHTYQNIGSHFGNNRTPKNIKEVEKYIKMINPKNFVITDDNINVTGFINKNFLKQYKNLQTAYNLIPNQSYDLYVRTRYDLFFSEVDLIENVNDGEIVSLNCFYNGNLRKFNPKNVIYKCPEKLFCDFFTVMSSKNIADKFFNIYDDLKTTRNHHLEDFFYKRILEYGFSHRKINSDILTFLR